jgi:hypothetical protein
LMDTVIVQWPVWRCSCRLGEGWPPHEVSQPGLLHAQLRRGIEGSSLILNIATWESVEALRNDYRQEVFQKP